MPILHEIHHICLIRHGIAFVISRKSYCNARNATMERSINDGRNLGAQIDVILLQQLTKSFLEHESIIPRSRQHTITDPAWIPAPTSPEILQRVQAMRSWSELATFTPIISIEEFFNEDLPLPLPGHPLEKSPCYPIIDFKAAGKYILYSCALHPKTENVNLESIEHHCKYDNADTHRAEIISRMTPK
jgi:hypothetical protein